jgi:hypothetical protein
MTPVNDQHPALGSFLGIVIHCLLKTAGEKIWVSKRLVECFFSNPDLGRDVK